MYRLSSFSPDVSIIYTELIDAYFLTIESTVLSRHPPRFIPLSWHVFYLMAFAACIRCCCVWWFCLLVRVLLSWSWHAFYLLTYNTFSLLSSIFIAFLFTRNFYFLPQKPTHCSCVWYICLWLHVVLPRSWHAFSFITSNSLCSAVPYVSALLVRDL